MEDQKQAVMMIEFGVTRQPEAYQSVRCGVTLPVFVQLGDDVHTLLRYHLEVAKETVRAQVDNEFEQGHGAPAVYSAEPRFKLMLAREAKVMIVIPMEQEDKLPEGWERELSKEYRKHRLGYILQQSVRDYPDFTLVDCSDGDLSKLPPLEVLTLWTYRPDGRSEGDKKMFVLVRPGAKLEGKVYPGWWSSGTHLREYGAALVSEIEAKAAKAESLFFDCTDGDFSRLPTPPVVQEPEPDEDDQDYDDDQEDPDDDD